MVAITIVNTILMIITIIAFKSYVSFLLKRKISKIDAGSSLRTEAFNLQLYLLRYPNVCYIGHCMFLSIIDSNLDFYNKK